MKRRTPEKAHDKLSALNETIDRLHRRLFRTVNALAAAVTSRRRLLRPRPLDQLDPPVPAVTPAAAPLFAAPLPEPNDPVPALDDGDLVVSAKKKRHAAASKAKKADGLAKQPLEGKAALKAIRG
jgi:hypothetical protein